MSKIFNHGLPMLLVGVWLFLTSLQLTAAPSSYEYYILNPRIENGALSVISLVDRNTIQAGATTLILNRYQTGSIPAGPDLIPGIVISATGSFTLGSQVDATDLPVPGHFIGTKFVIPHFRNDHTYYILSPKADAQVTITLGGVPTSITALKGQVLIFPAGSTNSISGLIQSNQPILVSHTANGGVYDVYPVPPVARELWGIRSNAAIVGAMEDNTTITVTGSSGATENFILNAGDYRSLTIPGGSQGSGSAVHIVADKPIAAIQSADNDGAETTAFLDTPYLATHYGLPINTQYVAVVCPQLTNVTLTNGTVTETQSCVGDGTQPGKAYFGSITNGININAGAYLEADRPVYIYYEASVTNDEHNIIGRKDNYYSLNSRFQNGPLSVMSLVDDNWITAGNSTLFLNQHELGTISGTELLPGTEIWGTGPFTLGSEVDGTDLPMPGSFAGTTFIIPHARDTHTYYLSSPYGEATVSVDIGGTVSSYTVAPDQVININAGSDTTTAGIIKSNRPILVSHQGGASGDAYPVPPAATELWGIRSTGAHMAAVENNTTVRVYSSDAQTATYTLNAGVRQNINIGANTSQGQGAALHLIADKPIAAYQLEDSDGYEATAFLQRAYHGTRSGLPVDTQYASVVCPRPNTTVTLYESTKPPDTRPCFAIGEYPGKLYFGSATNGANIAAGSYLDADQPIYVIYEASATNDEHNLLGYNLLTAPDPSVPVLNALPATTEDNPLTVTGTATPGMEVRLYVNGNQQATTTSAIDGSFSFSAALFDGGNEIYATTWDGSQESHHSTPVTVTYTNTTLRTWDNSTISTDTVWTPGLTPTPYTITGTLTVQAGVTFTIQPGTTLQFNSGAELFVRGIINIQGKADNQVILTGLTKTRGSWNGVYVYKNSVGNVIKNTVIEWAVDAIDMYGARATIQDNIIRDFSFRGIYLHYGSSGFIYNNIIDNGYVTLGAGLTTTGISVRDPSISLNIEGNVIQNTDIGIGISNGSTPQITNGNRITKNKYGLYLTGGSSSGVDPVPVVTGNSIYDNGINETGDRLAGRDYYASYWEDHSIVLDATENWWGTADLNDVASRIREAGDISTSPIVNFGNYLDADGGQPASGNYIYREIDDTTLQLIAGETYFAITTLTVPEGKMLTVPEGVKFKFRNNTGINVNGTLSIMGSIGSPVIFDSANGELTTGNWSGIQVNAGGIVSIAYADIRHATYGVRFNAGSTGLVINSTITLNNYGIYVYGDDVVANNPTPEAINNNIFDNGIIAGTRYVGRDYYAANFADAENTILNATGNWWGYTAPEAIVQWIYDHIDSTSSPVVDYSGFLDDAGNPVAIADNYLNGVFTSDTTLIAGTAYDVHGDLHILAGVTLTIEAGAQLRFGDASWDLIVDGSLVVQGAAGNEVVFTSSKAVPAAGDWGSIQVNSGATVLIDYAVIEYANYGVLFNAGSGGQVRNSTITANTYGIYVSGDGVQANNPMPVVTGNRIYDNGIINNYYRNSGRDYYAVNFADTENTVLDATNNWWGDIAPDVVAQRIYDHIDSIYSPVVDYSGFLDGAGNPDAGNYLNGAIASDTTLIAGTFYDVLGDLHVMAGATLTIEAGVQLRFADVSWNVIVDGSLVVQGSAGNEVVFTSSKPSPAAGDWGGIQVNSGATTVAIDYAVIEYARYGIYFNSASGTVRNSLIRFNTTGIYITGTSSPALTTNRIVYSSDYGIQIIGTNNDDTNPRPVITGNDIYGNPWGELYVTNFGSNSAIVLDVTGNWWGTDTPVDGQQIRYGGGTPGAGSGFINYTGYAAAPLSNPVFTAFTISEAYITPNADGNKDATTISASISVLANWTLTVTDNTNTVIRSFSGTGTLISQPWDGTNASGQTVPDGAYRVVIQAADAATGTEIFPVSGTVAVYTAAPTAIISSPSDTNAVSDIINISGTAKSANNGGITYTVDYASTSSPDVWTILRNGSYFVSDGSLATWTINSYRDEVFVANGSYLIRLTVRDTSSGMVTSDQVTVTVDNMIISNVVRTNDVINPSKSETATINFDINQSANVIVRIVPESTVLKFYPDQTPEPDAVRTILMGTLAAGTQSITWGGRDDVGNIVDGDAYIYVIEAISPAGRFDKFNTYNSLTSVVTEPVIDSGSITPYNPYKNEFISLTFDSQNTAFRGSFRIQYIDSSGQRITLWPVYQAVWPSSSSTAFWDGRDDDGNIVMDIQSIEYNMSGQSVPRFSNPSGIKTNYILVQGGKPEVPGISLKSDPYIIYLSYGQVTQLQYTLADDANVTVTVKEPVTGVETVLLNNVAQAVGDYTVPWEGQGNDGDLVPSEGHYTFTITATNPATGLSTVRRGNISVFQ